MLRGSRAHRGQIGTRQATTTTMAMARATRRRATARDTADEHEFAEAMDLIQQQSAALRHCEKKITAYANDLRDAYDLIYELELELGRQENRILELQRWKGSDAVLPIAASIAAVAAYHVMTTTMP